MAKVRITGDRYTVDSLYQWDLNQTLNIYGLSLATVPEIHFANGTTDTALICETTMDDAGVISANIPNILLQTATPIYAYVCLDSSGIFNSLHTIKIPVNGRQKPSDYIYTETEVRDFKKLSEDLKKYIDDEIANASERIQQNVHDGKDGVDGKTAYEYAVGGGYEGSEEDFEKDVSNLASAGKYKTLVDVTLDDSNSGTDKIMVELPLEDFLRCNDFTIYVEMPIDSTMTESINFMGYFTNITETAYTLCVLYNYGAFSTTTGYPVKIFSHVRRITNGQWLSLTSGISSHTGANTSNTNVRSMMQNPFKLKHEDYPPYLRITINKYTFPSGTRIIVEGR